MEVPPASSQTGQVSHGEKLQIRDYQLEMLERSLKENVIIAMDTGSGKTEIAVLRMRAELERCDSTKRIWFLAPTVALCEQQHRYIRSRLPDTSPLLLTGSSGVDYWSKQSIWDDALHNHRIVISTHAVLQDAMAHGFVKLASLALLIFDEAHHCHKNHAANMIMRLFYHKQKALQEPHAVPHILGLSASPVRSSGMEEIHQFEQNLDSLCVTPRIYRQELLAHVHRPEFKKVEFSESSLAVRSGSPLLDLQLLHLKVKKDIETVLRKLSSRNGSVISPRSFDQYEKNLCTQSVEQFRKKSEHVNEELGPWAADYFIEKTNELYIGDTSTFAKTVSCCDELLRQILAHHFPQPGSRNSTKCTSIDHPNSLSDKAVKLVELISQQSLDTVGVIFVKERVIVSILFHILSTHPQTAERFKFATFVGLSNNTKKRFNIHELLDLKSQNESLEAFRAQEKHMIIATDVLEEGIDVAACNLVICFDPPNNLKSFIQRRGRARKQHSLFVIMQSQKFANNKLGRWAQLEEEVVRICQDEARVRQAALSAENQDEELDRILQDVSTGATLTENACKTHLHHFCNTLPTQPFLTTDPCFSILDKSADRSDRMITAKVMLPNCVGAFQRSYSTTREYRTEQGAMKAAAYGCYRALYGAKLVNNNFLPSILDMKDHFKDLPSTIEVDEQIEPWRDMAHAWSSPEVYRTTVQIEREGLEAPSSLHFSLITPTPIPAVSFPSSKRHAGVTLKQISGPDTAKSMISLEQLGRHKKTMATLCLLGKNQKPDITKLDFAYVFDFGDRQELLLQAAQIDVGDVMTQTIGQVEKFIIADLLQKSIFPKCKFRNATHIVTALTAPSTGMELNFERYEFLGDAILKMVISAQTFADHVTWPAGWLSQYRDNFISNSSLANAALSQKLDQYIITKAQKTSSRAIPRISEAMTSPEKRILSSKTLADVLQALFAAAYLDSGYSLARSCMKVFIPEIQSEQPIFEMPHGASTSPHGAEELQKLTGYEFRNITILLQALTHPSCASPNSEESYQRLAFIGDAVLGGLVTKAVFQHSQELREGRMTQIRAAALNSNMLGYICMKHGILRKVFDIEAKSFTELRKTEQDEFMPLWKYMRHQSKDLGEARDACNTRYHLLHNTLQQEMQMYHYYPWLTLAKLQPEKFYSELIQSVIGAIYVDSAEDWSACQRFIEKIGISSFLQRAVQPDYDVAHPRSILQQLAPTAEVKSQPSGDGLFSCAVNWDTAEIGRAEGCNSEDEAKTLASQMAILMLAKKEVGA